MTEPNEHVRELELKLRVLQRGTLVGFIVLGLLLIYVAVDRPDVVAAKRVEAEELVLRDQTGRTLASLTVPAPEFLPELRMYDKQGELLGILDGASLTLPRVPKSGLPKRQRSDALWLGERSACQAQVYSSRTRNSLILEQPSRSTSMMKTCRSSCFPDPAEGR